MSAEIRTDGEGRYYHCSPDGEPLYPARYRAVSAYAEGLAVAYRTDGAVALIDVRGREIDLGSERFAWVLPPVKGQALARTVEGRDGWIGTTGRFHAHREDPEWEARCEMVRVARLIYERGYNVSIDGNLSVGLAGGELLLTPSGCHLGFLKPQDLVVTDRAGALVRGDRPPTSEFRLHTALYAARDDVRCVVHVHSPFAVAASLAGVDLAQAYITVAPVPTTAYARISSAESPKVLAPFVEDYNWAILPRHGTVAWAQSLWAAFLRIEGLEHAARIVMTAKASGPIEPMSTERSLELLTFWGLEHLEVPRVG
jgi:L-fuculose-phosphate aldolase